MPGSTRILLTPTVLLFAASAVLFLVAGAMRRRLDDFLKLHTGHAGEREDMRQLKLFENWRPGGAAALAAPERRWTYDQDYLVDFVDALQAGRASAGQERSWLSVYEGQILGLDIAFAVSFAAFIALASCLIRSIPELPPWVECAMLSTAAFGILYGVTDVLEDVMLKRILAHAQEMFFARVQEGYQDFDTALIDAAQADAANMLTRLKLITINASIIGGVVFFLLLTLDGLIGKMGGPKSPNSNPIPPLSISGG